MSTPEDKTSPTTKGNKMKLSNLSKLALVSLASITLSSALSLADGEDDGERGGGDQRGFIGGDRGGGGFRDGGFNRGPFGGDRGGDGFRDGGFNRGPFGGGYPPPPVYVPAPPVYAPPAPVYNPMACEFSIQQPNGSVITFSGANISQAVSSCMLAGNDSTTCNNAAAFANSQNLNLCNR